jgi:hypothetical protein
LIAVYITILNGIGTTSLFIRVLHSAHLSDFSVLYQHHCICYISSESIVLLFCGPAMHGGVQQRPHSMALLYESCATFPLFARAKSCLSMLSTSAHFE